MKRDLYFGLIGTMLLQFLKIENITLQFLILEPYHQISSLSTWIHLQGIHLLYFPPWTILPFHRIARRPTSSRFRTQTSLRLPPYRTSRRREDLGPPPIMLESTPIWTSKEQAHYETLVHTPVEILGEKLNPTTMIRSAGATRTHSNRTELKRRRARKWGGDLLEVANPAP